MDDTQAKPLRPGRRWRMTACALMPLLLALWWFWPRGDARFFGKWSMSDAAVLPLRRSLEFFSDGISTNSLSDSAGVLVDRSTWRWEVRDDVLELTFVPPPDPTLPGFVRVLHTILKPDSDPPTRFRIVRCDEDRIGLRTNPIHAGYQPMDLELVRVRE